MVALPTSHVSSQGTSFTNQESENKNRCDRKIPLFDLSLVWQAFTFLENTMGLKGKQKRKALLYVYSSSRNCTESSPQASPLLCLPESTHVIFAIFDFLFLISITSKPCANAFLRFTLETLKFFLDNWNFKTNAVSMQ